MCRINRNPSGTYASSLGLITTIRDVLANIFWRILEQEKQLRPHKNFMGPKENRVEPKRRARSRTLPRVLASPAPGLGLWCSSTLDPSGASPALKPRSPRPAGYGSIPMACSRALPGSRAPGLVHLHLGDQRRRPGRCQGLYSDLTAPPARIMSFSSRCWAMWAFCSGSLLDRRPCNE